MSSLLPACDLDRVPWWGEATLTSASKVLCFSTSKAYLN